MWLVNPGLTNSDSFAGLGMRAHDGMFDRRERCVRLAVPLAAAVVASLQQLAELAPRRRARR